jgi:methylated-DNA-[protein]-cysteine S-methyltransferase
MSAARDSEANCVIDSPFGKLRITATKRAVTRLIWIDEPETPADRAKPGHPLLAQAVLQLEEYFAGTRRDFELPLDPPGGAFQQSVCRAMLEIPFGQTRTYGDLARQLGVAPQPIGQGCGGNPIPILIPCHRVMAADGKLGGFSGGRGPETKLALLRHEGAILI